MAKHSSALAQAVGQLFVEHRWTLVIAESCTGGGVAEAITSIAGSSRYFDRGFVTYSNAAKVQMLGVEIKILEKYGAVSEQTARAMAEGALRHSAADVAVAVTGIAGPEGGSPDKPVGTVWFAWAGKTFPTRVAHVLFSGDRTAIRAQAVEKALQGLLEINLHPVR